MILTSEDLGNNSGFRASKVCLRDLTITGQIYTNSAPEDYLWIEDCELRGGGPGGVSHWKEGWWTGVYAVNSRSYDSIMGFPFAALARRCVADTIYIDAFPGGQAIVNCTVRNHIGGQHPETGYVYHPDIWQERSPATDFDVIIYGLRADENNIRQAFFTRNFTGHVNVAIVNSSVYLGGYPYRSFLGSTFDHFLVMNNSILGSCLELGLSDNHPQVPGFGNSEDVLFDGNIFQWVPVSDEADEHPFWTESDWSSLSENSIYFGRNHFVNRWPHAPEQRPWNASMLGVSPSEGPDIPGDLGPIMD